MNINQLDLNLLRVFDAVFRERNVTRAAEALHLTQPALSNALNRLRDALGDPLFIRASRGVTPTPRALALAQPIARALAEIAEALQPGSFDPSQSDHLFRIACTDWAGALILPSLARYLAQNGPRLRLRCSSVGGDVIEQLREGKVDMHLGLQQERADDCESKILLRDRFICVMRKDHPLMKGPFDAAAYATADHLLISPKGDFVGVIDDALHFLGLRRRVAMTVNQHAVAPGIVAVTDLIVTMTERMASIYAGGEAWARRPLPIPPPATAVAMITHKTLGRTGPNAWLRQAIEASLAAIDDV